MTSMPAARMKLADRGRIAPGMKADLVLFDPDTVIDRSTFEHPRTLAEGISRVWVNGQEVWKDGKTAGATPGRVLYGPGRETAATAASR
jgi:N-acyl-D-aspartate/D-glutamate deacylase